MNDYVLQTFKDYLKEARESTNPKLSQKELAAKTHLSIASIQGYEQGKFEPKQQSLNKIIEILAEHNADIALLSILKDYLRIPKLFAFDKKNIEFFSLPEEQRMILVKNEDVLSDLLRQLNSTGQDKLVEYAIMLTKIPEYQRE